MFQNQAYCLQSIPSHRNQSPCHIFTTGGGSEHNEGERTLAYYPKIDDKYCFLDVMACLESMLESEQDETLPEALRTQALTALTHNFGLYLCKQLNFLFLICSNKTVTEKGFEAWDLLLGKGDLI